MGGYGQGGFMRGNNGEISFIFFMFIFIKKGGLFKGRRG